MGGSQPLMILQKIHLFAPSQYKELRMGHIDSLVTELRRHGGKNEPCALLGD